MVRPRWHDAVIVSAIVALLVVGVWSLWGDDVRSLLGRDAGSEAPAAPIASTSAQT
jgi:hypothetical protein